MYSYHNRIKQRIRQGELTGYNLVNGYNGESDFKMVLYFSTEPTTRPIREHRVEGYLKLLANE